MTGNDGWEKCGDLWLKKAPYDKNNPEQRNDALHVLRGSVKSVAQKHGATPNEKGLRNNERALSSGDLWVDLYLAKWDVCEPKAIYVGGALGWESYGFTPEGQLVRSFYTEEVTIFRSQLRKLIEANSDGKEFPKESLAECFERLSLNQMRNDGIVYRYGEVDPDNKAMMRQLYGNKTDIGIGPDSAVLEYRQMPIDLKAAWFTPVIVVPIFRGGVRDENNFYVQWKVDNHDIRFLVTKGQATTKGQPRADIFPWHNGNLPEKYILESVIASSLTSIKQEIDGERKWGKDRGPQFPAPIVPSLTAPRPEMYRALRDAARNEIVLNGAGQPATISKPISDAHVYVQNNAEILDGFLANYAAYRLFGNKRMIPAVNDMSNQARLVM